MKEQYGSDKGESVFYASRNKGVITGVEGRKSANKGGLIQGFPKLAKNLFCFFSSKNLAVEYNLFPSNI